MREMTFPGLQLDGVRRKDTVRARRDSGLLGSALPMALLVSVLVLVPAAHLTPLSPVSTL